MSLVNALKNGNVTYTGNSASNVTINVGNGNSNISVKGNNVDITAGTGNQNVVVLGNDVNIKLDQNAPADFDFSNDRDTVAVVSDKGNVKINTGDGNDTALAVADNVKIDMGDGNHLIGFWGDDVKVNVGDGNNNIYTMDKMIQNGIIDENTTMLGDKVGKAAVDAVSVDTYQYTEVLKDITTVSNKSDKASFLADMKNNYKLNDTNMKMLEQLYDSGDLFKEYASGVPQYAILQSVEKKGQYVLAKVDSQRADGYIHARGLRDNGSFGECLATKQRGTTSYTEQQTVTNEKTQRDVYVINGTKNLEVKTGSGTTSDLNVTSTGVVKINTGDFDLNNIKVDAEVRIIGEPEVIKNVYTQAGKVIKLGTNIASTYTSPIIVDFNKDGKVDAESGKGVDVDGNGIVDGAATGGDKMLAMSDMNGNGTIDGSEVFGDKTVDPFTGEAINAANGFEALKVVAQSAYAKTGINCMTGDFVNLVQLKDALNSIGVNLGFISDDNITELEDLAHVQALTVTNYNQVEEEGDVQHRQQGAYLDAQGNEYSADDVWFKNRTEMDDMIARLKKGN